MIKPKKRVKTYYDYVECRDYINAKYKIDIDDVNNTLKEVSGAPYQNFWNFVTDNFDIRNDCDFSLSETDKEYAEEWQVKIIDLFLTEFGENDAYLGKSVDFNVQW